MKTKIQLMAAATAVCLVTGCETTGLSPRESSGGDYPNYIMGLDGGKSAAEPPKPSLPIHLAVVQVGETAPPDTLLDKFASQKTLVASVTGLPLPGTQAGEYVPYYRNRTNDPASIYSSRIQTVCRLARDAGADYVFLFGGTIDSWRKNNALSALDFTIIGGAVLPGGKINLEGKSAGVLIAAATAQPVFFVNADERNSAISPDFLANGKTTGLRAQMRDKLVDDLGVAFLNKLAAAPAAN